MDFTAEQIRWILMAILALVASIAVHEFGHAIVADRLGDDLPRRQGRVTLNPMAHADPIGTLLLPLVLAATGLPGFGWGKPVMVRPERFSRRFSMTTAHTMVSLAGPMMNLILGFVLVTVHVVLVTQGVLASGAELSRFLAYTVILNFTLFFFNLLPVSPLDGSKVILSVLPRRWRDDYNQAMVYGPFVLLGLLAIPPLQKVFTIPAQTIARAAYFGLEKLVG